MMGALGDCVRLNASIDTVDAMGVQLVRVLVWPITCMKNQNHAEGRERPGRMIDNPTILVVDDDEFLCGMLEDVLTDSGYRVVTARSPREAFDAFADHLFEVVLTDLNLGDESGFEILERLSAEAHSPITILMTAFMNNETEARARELGAYETLCKINAFISLRCSAFSFARSCRVFCRRGRPYVVFRFRRRPEAHRPWSRVDCVASRASPAKPRPRPARRRRDRRCVDGR